LTLEQFRAEADRLRLEAEEAARYSALPDETDRSAVSELVARVHLEFWRREAWF
jgi:hypothetical protein